MMIELEHKGNLMIRDLWAQVTNYISDTQVVNTGVASYVTNTPDKSFSVAERQKKGKYLEACIQQQRQFTTLFISLNSLMSTEAEDTMKIMACCLATKFQKPYSRTCGYVLSRVAITIVRSNHRCIQGS